MYAARFALLRLSFTRTRDPQRALSPRVVRFIHARYTSTGALFTDTNKLCTANRLALSTDRESDIVKFIRPSLKAEVRLSRSSLDGASGTVQ